LELGDGAARLQSHRGATLIVRVGRRGYILPTAASLAVAAAVAILLIILLDDDGEAKLTRAEYIARVEAVCRDYNRRLARVPAPVAVGNPQAVAQSIDQALPLVEERAARAKGDRTAARAGEPRAAGFRSLRQGGCRAAIRTRGSGCGKPEAVGKSDGALPGRCRGGAQGRRCDRTELLT
jgi:hypothetical protein